MPEPATSTLEITTPVRYVWQQKVIHKLFSGMPVGGLLLRYSDGTEQKYGAESHEIEAEILLNEDNEFFRRGVAYGNVGLGEAYIEGIWDTPDIKAVITWFIRNMKAKMGAQASSNKLRAVNKMKFINKLFHIARANTIRTSKKNISEHYDLGNDFYKLFLDPSMTYSSGIFTKKDTTLEEAQFEKYDALCKKLQLKKGDEVLEIGCGWGGFACHAAAHYGCKVTGVTISQEQLNYGHQRAKDAGLETLIDLRLQDYREITGKFDHIVSIEMLEAVGDKFLPVYFKKCNELLKPNGALGIQIITVPDSRYDELKRGVDFIQRHIFPGSLLLSLGRISQVMKKTGELTTFQVDDMGLDYARTLSEWHDRFNAELPAVKAQGFDDAFIRKWNYYLKYCEAAFATRNISVVQAIYTKPNNEKLIPVR
jgi:cyclopropane-fatty-acyl-phospholipid synthase|tara:strand:+ start:23050 stop:24321 length:1272 start_codon:yes stop_codon:yes gene_type:complete